jgi:xylulokinase
MFLGIDLGVRHLSVALVDDQQRIVEQAEMPIATARSRPGLAEQSPNDWWKAATKAIAKLKRNRAKELSGVAAVGVSGQRGAPVLLDRADKPIRAVMLAEDRRCLAECDEFRRRAPTVHAAARSAVGPQAAAPKLLWLANKESESLRNTACILMPKDWLRLILTGERATDPSDASRTLLYDLAAGDWSEAMCAAAGVPRATLPPIKPSAGAGGRLDGKIAEEWGLPAGIPVAVGATDGAAGMAAAGALSPGLGVIALDGRGEVAVVTDTLPDAVETLVTYCHCLPGLFVQASPVLDADRCLAWLTALTGSANEAALLAEAGMADREAQGLIFLPYLTGAPSPHDDPGALGVFFGLTLDTARADLTRAALEGIAFAFADGLEQMTRSDLTVGDLSIEGRSGGSPFWGRILASVLGRTLIRLKPSTVGPAFGAARLARLAAGEEAPEAVMTRPPMEFAVHPSAGMAEQAASKQRDFQQLYRTLQPSFAAHD